MRWGGGRVRGWGECECGGWGECDGAGVSVRGLG
jgi:hypothetical protein